MTTTTADPDREWALQSLKFLELRFDTLDLLSIEPLIDPRNYTILASLTGSHISNQVYLSIESFKDQFWKLAEVEEALFNAIQAGPPGDTLPTLLDLFASTCLIHSIMDLIQGTQDPDLMNHAPISGQGLWLSSVARLDRAIVTAGGEDTDLLDCLLECIKRIQGAYLPSSLCPIDTPRNLVNRPIPPPLAAREVLRIDPPTMQSFLKNISAPSIISSYASDWPALTSRPWDSLNYLRNIAGRGRAVPVESGSDYTKKDWLPMMMNFDDFLDAIELDSPERAKMYLAQHNLFNQFPQLRGDIEIPPYVYSAPPPIDDFPSYSPPANTEELILNVWLGPEGTVTPAHTDPFYNCYVQVAGRKTVWLAPPSSSPAMYPYDSLLSNTSQVDVFAPQSLTTDTFPLFIQDILPDACYAVLNPGDLLLFPPGWWHAMRSEDRSMSISIWF